MSADNWAICPKCLAEAKASIDEQRAKVYATYGTVPIEEFDRLRDELPELRDENYRTFREDYEIYGADSGLLHVSYSGHCSECGLGLDFEDEKMIWKPDGDEP